MTCVRLRLSDSAAQTHFWRIHRNFNRRDAKSRVHCVQNVHWRPCGYAGSCITFVYAPLRQSISLFSLKWNKNRNIFLVRIRAIACSGANVSTFISLLVFCASHFFTLSRSLSSEKFKHFFYDFYGIMSWIVRICFRESFRNLFFSFFLFF